MLRDLQTSSSGLTQTEADERARTAGLNEIAQERKQGWFLRVLKIIRNPLVILLSALSIISFLTGDMRAGSVMFGMVVLGVGLRFVQESRADAAAAKLKAMINVTGDRGPRRPAAGSAAARTGPGDVVQLAAGDMIPADVRVAVLQGPLHHPGEPHRRVVARREVRRPGDRRRQARRWS